MLLCVGNIVDLVLVEANSSSAGRVSAGCLSAGPFPPGYPCRRHLDNHYSLAWLARLVHLV